jgi:HEAT repeat protein
LYPGAHPTARKVLTDFQEALQRHLERHGSIKLRIEEAALFFEDQEVYFQEELRASIAFLMFRDGLRFLVFHPGIDESEASAFVDCLAHSDDLASLEHDLATVLWERDLQHVEYEVADPFLGGSGQSLRDEAVNDLRNTVLRRLGELTPGDGVAGGAGIGGAGGGGGGGGDDRGGAGGEYVGEDDEQAPQWADPEVVTVTEADIKSGERAVASIDDVFDDFVVVLLEIAGVPEPPHGHDLLLRSLQMVVERLLETGDVELLGVMVDRLLALEQDGRRPPEFVASVFTEVATSERIATFIGEIDQATPAKLKQAEEVLARMRGWILPTVLELLTESNDRAARKIALDVLDMAGGVPTEHLWPLLRDPRWYVVRNAVTLATGWGHPQLLDRLEPLMRHTDARVRREVMRSADTVPGARPAALFARALNDDDISVRVLAANGLARHGSRVHAHGFETQIESRDFATRPLEEINAILSAYAALGGEATVEVLNRVWRHRVIGTKPLPVRLGALQALGLVGTPSALEALTEASNSGESQIQKAAMRALADARTRTWGDRA